MTTNHPANGPVSLDRLHQIREILSKAAAQSDGGNLGYAMADAVKVIDGSISAFDADPQRNPVLAYADSYRDMAKRGVESIPVWSVITDLERNIAPLYATPPSPVVPDDVLDALQKVARIRLDLNDFDGDRRGIADCLGNAEEALIEVVNRSAAMLQGAEPVSDHVELPLDFLHGHKDGLEWAAQMAEANHPQTGDWLYDDPIELARAIRKGPDMPTAQAGNHTEQHLDMVDHSGDANKMVAGNSPVIGIDLASEPDRSVEVRYLAPPGYVIVPIVPTEDMIINGFESIPDPHFSDEKEWEEYEALSGCRQAARRAELCWAAMIKAAPKQENI